MKILHTADWHLGKKLDFFSRLDEQKEVLTEICVLADAHEVDVVIVAGDLFDTFNPPVEAIELLYQTLRRLTKDGSRPVIAIAGNHDSADRIDAPDSLARACGILFIGYPQAKLQPSNDVGGFSISKTDAGFLEIMLPQYPYPLRLLTTAYANELRLKQYLGLNNKEQQLNELLHENWQSLADKYCDNQGVNILTAHLYMLKRGGEILEEPEGEKPIKIGNADIVYTDGIPLQIQYTALGHLHRHQNIGGHPSPVVYSSSPLPYSFSEAGQEKQVVLVDAQPGQAVSYQALPLRSGRQLHRKRFEDLDLAITWLHANPNSLVELTLVSETFASAQDIKRIHEAHDGIIQIIPVVNKVQASVSARQQVNLEQDMPKLFEDYFRFRHGQELNVELQELFNEIINHNPNEQED